MKLSNLFFFVLLVLFLVSLHSGNMLYDAHNEENKDINLPYYTDNMMNWSNMSEINDVKEFDNTSDYEMSNVTNVRVSNIITKNIDAFGYTMFEIIKIGFEHGYSQGDEYENDSLVNFLLTVTWIMLIVFCFVPAVAIGIAIHELYKYIKNKKRERKKG